MVNGISFEWRAVEAGVIQGSKLSPILFFIFIIDINDIIPYVLLKIYIYILYQQPKCRRSTYHPNSRYCKRFNNNGLDDVYTNNNKSLKPKPKRSVSRVVESCFNCLTKMSNVEHVAYEND